MNLTKCIQKIYPEALLDVHFVPTTIDGTPTIQRWSYGLPQPSPAQIRAAEIQVAREESITSIRTAFASRMNEGITIGGVTLQADPESLALFTGLAAFLSLALTTQAITPDAPQTLYSNEGTPVTAPASQVSALLLAYGAAYATAFNAMKAEITALD